MLYVFKSKVTSNLLLLEANGNQILQIIGREPQPKGVLLPEEMLAAIARLERAIEQEKRQPTEDDEEQSSQQRAEPISLKQRAQPFIKMLQRCEAAKEEVTWGV